MRTNFDRKRISDTEVIRDFIENTDTVVYTNVEPKHYLTLQEIVNTYGNNIPVSLTEKNQLTYSHDLDNPMKKRHFDLADLPGERELEEQNKATREKLSKLEQLDKEAKASQAKKHAERLAKLDALNQQNTPPAET